MGDRRWARRILAADGVGCALAAGVVLGSRQLGPGLEPIANRRLQIALALGATSALLLTGAGRRRLSDRDLEGAAVVNAGWVVVCLAALRRRPPRVTAALIGATAVLDAGAAAAQWHLRSEFPSRQPDGAMGYPAAGAR
ncbi:MAG TPA: hypothetical protein VK095_15570 [Beutenbergiaceae bacterium]|nr:hypothetical protein [Beutenbergiaceae bacterium]